MDRDYYTYADFRAGLRPNEQGAQPIEHLVTDMRTPKEAPKPHAPRRRAPRRKHRALRGVAMATCLLILGISAVLLMADFLLPRGVAAYVVETFAPPPQCVYAVSAGAYDDLTEARATSDGVRKRGGAGFIAYDGCYHVLLSAYPDQSEAEAVAEKNGFAVYAIRTEGVQAKDLPLAYRSAAEGVTDYHVDLYRELYALSAQLAQEGTTVPYCKSRVASIREGLYSRAQSFLDATAYATDALTQNYRAALLAALAGLDNLVNHSTDAGFLTDLRWTYIMILRINRI